LVTRHPEQSRREFHTGVYAEQGKSPSIDQTMEGEVSAQGCYVDGGGGLIRSSVEAPVMGVERRDQHVQALFIQQPAFVGTIEYEEPISQPKTDF